jgi:hypothetical protein
MAFKLIGLDNRESVEFVSTHDPEPQNPTKFHIGSICHRDKTRLFAGAAGPDGQVDMAKLQERAVDIVLAALLLIGSVSGAQVGAQLAQRILAEKLRFVLAAIVLLVALRMALGLGWRPDEIYTVTPS